MSAKIDFFFTHGHSFTATNVVPDSVEVFDHNTIVYSTNSFKNDVLTSSVHNVPMHDLKFAVVTYGADTNRANTSNIIHGLVTKFDITPTYEQVQAIRTLEIQEKEAAARNERRRVKEAEKFVKRRAKRSAERKESFTK